MIVPAFTMREEGVGGDDDDSIGSNITRTEALGEHVLHSLIS